MQARFFETDAVICSKLIPWKEDGWRGGRGERVVEEKRKVRYEGDGDEGD
jgi:hypothetical protein